MNVSALKPLRDAALGLLYPETCQICNHERAKPAEGFVCPPCWKKIHFIRPPFCDRCGLPFQGAITTKFECANCREMDLHFSYARSAVVANAFLLEIIHRYKYQRALWFEPFLADLLIREAAPVLAKNPYDLIIPVPLHPAKQREREFNQAGRLATRLSRATQIPLNAKLLRRVKPTQTQTHFTRSERAKNMQDAFALRVGEPVNGRRIVILDDVFTTGATTSACAKVLLSAGAAEVSVWTVARGI
ncbi:MAG TPA: ComF family protein [Verrucomicrobiae bacterium]|jgi:ComF family protein|nr:ComF family protein [Verrucomicrobiae bacterium]